MKAIEKMSSFVLDLVIILLVVVDIDLTELASTDYSYLYIHTYIQITCLQRILFCVMWILRVQC